MKHALKLKTSIVMLLLTGSLLLGCRSSHEKPRVADFSNRNCWDPAKQERWFDFQAAFQAQYYRLRAVDDSSSQDMPSDDGPHPNQSDLDRLEKRRTGNLRATSCRKALIPGRAYDASNCSSEQLAAELFQEDEENQGHK